jgi:hypothetical protein
MVSNRLKVHDHANRDTRRGAEVKLSVPTAGVDDRTDDCACGADDVAVPAKVQISTFSDDRLQACATLTHCHRHRTPLLERCPSCFVSDPLRAISDSTTGHIRCRKCDGSLLLHNREEPTTLALAKVISLEESILAALRGKPPDPYWCAKLSATEFVRKLEALVNSLTCGGTDSGFLLVVEGDAQWEEHLRSRQAPEAFFPVFSWRWRLLLMGSLVELLEDRKMSTG